MNAKKLDAPNVMNIGMIQHISKPTETFQDSIHYLESLSTSHAAQRGLKKLLTWNTEELDSALKVEGEIFSSLWGGKDNLDALANVKK